MFEDTMSATEKSERNCVCTKNNKRGRNTTRRVRGEKESARGRPNKRKRKIRIQMTFVTDKMEFGLRTRICKQTIRVKHVY